MADQTDLTLPLTPAKLGRAIGAIVEAAFPSPRQENCIAVGEMERALTALCGEAVQLAYDDTGQDIVRLRTELADAKAKVRAVSLLRCWLNEDGKRFIFVADVQEALGVPVEDEVTSHG